ncbi:MAG: hypothetical protein BGN88_12390 [Clostridiales bacterium 43-6]|nr:MAG: hypothetical protein BGN88_12390 [Clostridiales bacterium 43-6]
MKKRMIATAICIVFVIAMVGCNANELGLINTIKAMLSLTEFTYEGTISCDVNKLGINEEYFEDYGYTDEDIEYMEQDLNSIKELLGASLSYHGVVSKADKKITFNLTMVGENNDTTNLFNIMLIEKVLYINEDMVYTYGLEPDSYETIDGVYYGVFDVDDLIHDYISSQKNYLVDEPYGMYPYFDDAASEDFINGAMAGYDVGLYDGYFNTDTKVEPAGTQDYKDGYQYGYDIGYSDGQFQKEQYNQDLEYFDGYEETLTQNIDATKIIKNMNMKNTVFSKSLEGIAEVLFKDFSLNLVKKSGNQYSVNTTAPELVNSASQTILYVLKNEALVKTTLKTIVDKLSDEELENIGLDPAHRDEVKDEIDAIEFPTGYEYEQMKDDIENNLDALKDQIENTMQLSFEASLEQTGDKSFDALSTITLKTHESNPLPYEMDGAIHIEFYMNKLDVADISKVNGPTSASIIINAPEDIYTELGIVYSTKEDLAGSKTVKAVLSSNQYIVDLSGLNASTTYYYQTYAIDQDGKTTYGTVKSFKTAADGVIAPPTTKPENGTTGKTTHNESNGDVDTGADSSTMVFFFVIALSGATLLFTAKRKRSVN